jgi:hypothetical protein
VFDPGLCPKSCLKQFAALSNLFVVRTQTV